MGDERFSVWNYFKIYTFNPLGRMLIATPKRLAGARVPEQIRLSRRR
jgi:hypothetical protein